MTHWATLGLGGQRDSQSRPSLLFLHAVRARLGRLQSFGPKSNKFFRFKFSIFSIFWESRIISKIS
jgi:hypothetical protein